LVLTKSRSLAWQGYFLIQNDSDGPIGQTAMTARIVAYSGDAICWTQVSQSERMADAAKL
jgi:hypothetical protein